MNMRLLPTIFLTLASPALFAHGFLAVEERPLIQMNNYYPFGSHYEGGVSATWLREGEFQDANLFQVKELISQTGCLPAVASAEAGHDFGSRMYWADLGRWFSTDPQKQFSSPYVGMGNMPSVGVDPNGELAWFVPMIVGAVLGGTSQGIAAERAGGNFFDGVWKGALIGGIAGFTAAGTTALIAGTSITSATTASFGAVVAGGIAGGAVSGAGFAGLNSNWDIGAMLTGAWQGALTGLVSAGVGGAVSNEGYTGWGSFLGGAAGGATSAAFNDGDILGSALMGGALSYGVYRATAPKEFRSLSPSARKEVRLINELSKHADRNNEYLKVLDSKGKMPGPRPYFKGRSGRVPIEREESLVMDIVTKNKITYDIHSHPTDGGPTGAYGDLDAWLSYGYNHNSPGTKLITVGPTKVHMLSNYPSNWFDYSTSALLTRHTSSWNLHLHYHFPLHFGF